MELRFKFSSDTQHNLLPCLTSAHPFYNSADPTDLQASPGGPKPGLYERRCQDTGGTGDGACADRFLGCEGRLLLKPQAGARVTCRAAASAGTDGSGHWDSSAWLNFKHRIMSSSGSRPARFGVVVVLVCMCVGGVTVTVAQLISLLGYLLCARSGIRF